MAQTFSVGDKVVYPGHGVAEITGLEAREISGAKLEFYVLSVLENNMKVMVPKHNAKSVGLRMLVDQAEVEQVYSVLAHRGAKISTATWNRRYREYMEKIKTGSVFEIAEVMRDLCRAARQGAVVRRAQDARHRAAACSSRSSRSRRASKTRSRWPQIDAIFAVPT